MGPFPFFLLLIIPVEPHEYSVDEFKNEPFSEPTSKEFQAQKLNSSTMPTYERTKKTDNQDIL
jgi:hypothetical protein